MSSGKKNSFLVPLCGLMLAVSCCLFNGCAGWQTEENSRYQPKPRELEEGTPRTLQEFLGSPKMKY